MFDDLPEIFGQKWSLAPLGSPDGRPHALGAADGWLRDQ